MLAKFAEDEAKRIQRAMTFCVLDIHGNMVLKHRMDGSLLISVEMAERKAFAVAALQMKTEAMSDLAGPGQAFQRMTAAGDRYWIDGGGVPVVIDGEVVAGFGVSGGSIAEDVAVAEAAIAALKAS